MQFDGPLVLPRRSLVASITTIPILRRGSVLRRLLGIKLAVFALAFIGVVAVVALTASIAAPYDPNRLVTYTAQVATRTQAPAGMRWVARCDIAGEALPSVMRKVLAHAGRQYLAA